MNDLNWTALFGFWTAASLIMAYILLHDEWTKWVTFFLTTAVIFGSLTALTWGN